MADTLASMFPGRSRSELQSALDANAGSVEATVEYLLRPPASLPQQQAMPSRDSGLGDQPTIVYDTGNAIADRARARQLEQDEIMARALALEEEEAATSNPLNAMRDFAGGLVNQAAGAVSGAGAASGRRGTGSGPGSAAGGGGAGAGIALPSMQEVGAAVAPVVAGLQTAGRTAVDIVSGIYEDLVGSDSAGRPGSGYASVDSQQQQVLAARRRAAEADRESTSVVRGEGPSPQRPGLQQRRTGLIDGAGGISGDKKRE